MGSSFRSRTLRQAVLALLVVATGLAAGRWLAVLTVLQHGQAPPVPSLVDVTGNAAVALRYPGSVVAEHLDAGSSGGPTGISPAFATAVWTTRSSYRRVLAWWSARLRHLGWNGPFLGRPAGAQVLVDVYRKGTRELFEVAVDNPTVLARDGDPVALGRGQDVFESSLIIEPERILEVDHRIRRSVHSHESQRR